MSIKSLPLYVFLFIFSFYSYGQSSTHTAQAIDHFVKIMTTDLRKAHTHGSVSIAVSINGQLIWTGAIGYLKKDGEQPADTTTIYRIASITKTFTAVLLLQLTEQGKVKLDDAVEQYVPEVRNIKGYSSRNVITLRQLASHTSGLQREPALPGVSTGPVTGWESKILQSMPTIAFDHAPGTKYQYSNFGFALLGLALERAVGISYMNQIKKNILLPLQMSHTGFELQKNDQKHLAEGIVSDDKRSRDTIPREGYGYHVPDGSLYSTPADLTRFFALLLGKTSLLTQESLNQMKLVPTFGTNYGLGLIVAGSKDQELIGHNGELPGYSSRFTIETNSGYAVVILRNYNNRKTNLGKVATALLLELEKITN